MKDYTWKFPLAEILANVSDYDAVEIMPVTDLDRDIPERVGYESTMEVCEAGQEDLWSVYLHFKSGGVDCISDHNTEDEAADWYEVMKSILYAFGQLRTDIHTAPTDN